jgi:hypothetical protein
MSAEMILLRATVSTPTLLVSQNVLAACQAIRLE